MTSDDRAYREMYSRLQSKRRAYLDTMHADLGVLLSRWKLIKLLLVALVSPRPAYRLTWKGGLGRLNPAAQIVLADLERFCGVNDTGIVVSPVLRIADPNMTAYRTGQRDVYLRIHKFLGTSYFEDSSDARIDTASQ